MNKSQLEKFKALAEESECDTDEKKFDEALKGIAKPSPSGTSQQSSEKENERPQK
jgi:hypothetical protein